MRPPWPRSTARRVAHPLILGNSEARGELLDFWRRARAHNPDLAAIGSTDFHARSPLGLCRTYVFARELSEAGVVEAVRSGRTVSVRFPGACQR